MLKGRFTVELDADLSDLSMPEDQTTLSELEISGELRATTPVEIFDGQPIPMMVRLDEDNARVVSYETVSSDIDEQTTLAPPAEPTTDEQQPDEAASTLETFCEVLESESNVAYSIVDDEITFKGDGTDKDRFVDAIRVFFDHGHISVKDLPYQTPQAKKRYLLNTEPVHRSGKEMKGPAQPIPGVYVPTWRSREEKKTALRQLIYEFVDTAE